MYLVSRRWLFLFCVPSWPPPPPDHCTLRRPLLWILVLPLLPLSGVDWKSLSIPACLPITTDYFPDKRSLHNDYVISDYTLLPDDVNLDYAKSRAVYRKPLSTEEVCKEIVSQRLAQGFQLIVVEDKNPSNSNGSCSGANGPGSCGASNSNQSTSAVLPIKPPCETNKEYLLSIGRIFHKISLSGSVITVTGYRPRWVHCQMID